MCKWRGVRDIESMTHLILWQLIPIHFHFCYFYARRRYFMVYAFRNLLIDSLLWFCHCRYLLICHKLWISLLFGIEKLLPYSMVDWFDVCASICPFLDRNFLFVYYLGVVQFDECDVTESWHNKYMGFVDQPRHMETLKTQNDKHFVD